MATTARRVKSAILALVLGLGASRALAEPTHVMIRAQSLDAKFIGTHMGGVEITLTDAATGAVLAKGLTQGGSGDTARIMQTPHARGTALAEGDAAGFDAVLNLDRPTLVHAEAVGPAGKPGAAIHVASSLWVIPGRNVTGDGWVLTFPGLVVEPSALADDDGVLRVGARVTLMCGCPIEPGGLWDAANYAVDAALMSGDKVVAHAALAYGGHPSLFTGVLPKAPPGRYVLRLVATDAKTPNAGVAEQPVQIP